MARNSWYYLASGWFRKTRRVGPISEQDLLDRIGRGVIEPETLLQSSKTKDRWVPMEKVGPAMAHYRKIQQAVQKRSGNAKAG